MRAKRVLLVATVVASWAGCFESLDMPKIPCDPAKANSCPSGHACTPVVGAVEAGRLGEVASSRLDGSGIDGAGEAGGPRIDGGKTRTILGSNWVLLPRSISPRAMTLGQGLAVGAVEATHTFARAESTDASQASVAS